MVSQPRGHVHSHGLQPPLSPGASFESRGGDLFIINIEPQKMVTLSVIGDIIHLTHLPRGSLCSRLLWFHPLERGKETLLKGGTDIIM